MNVFKRNRYILCFDGLWSDYDLQVWPFCCFVCQYSVVLHWGVHLTSVHVWLLVGKPPLEQVFLRVLRFVCVSVILPIFDTNSIHLLLVMLYDVSSWQHRYIKHRRTVSGSGNTHTICHLTLPIIRMWTEVKSTPKNSFCIFRQQENLLPFIFHKVPFIS
jgi:hypothetical protein